MLINQNGSAKKILVIAVVAIVVLALALFLMMSLKKSEELPVAKLLIIETEHGVIEAELFPEDAPKTVARMAELAGQGYFDGLTFHRVVENFVVQGGDPNGDGTGGSGVKLPAEFNSRQHVEGTLAMARLPSDPNSADSQFYIALAKISYLDGQYTIWGQVTKGMDVVKKIQKGDKMIKVTAK